MSSHSPSTSTKLAPPPLAWSRRDIEERCGFRSRPFTTVNTLFSIILAVLLTILFYGSLAVAPDTRFSAMFTQLGPTPYFIIFFSAWSLVILLIKLTKLRLQKQSLCHEIVPDDPQFVLTPATAEEVIERLHAITDEPRYFVLYNRILVALRNLKNLGRVADVDDILRSQAEHDDQNIETSYSLLRGFIWAIPVLGFIGTVMGLSEAVGGFGDVLAKTSDVTEISGSLKNVTAGLATAFETTLAALVAALGIQLLATFVRKSEHEFLEACSDYCLTRIVSRLRIQQTSSPPAP